MRKPRKRDVKKEKEAVADWLSGAASDEKVGGKAQTKQLVARQRAAMGHVWWK